MTAGCDISSEIALRWTSRNLSDDKSILVQVMAWCRQATSHYLNQCWPRSLPSYGVTKPQWVKGYIVRKPFLQMYAICVFCCRCKINRLEYNVPGLWDLTSIVEKGKWMSFYTLAWHRGHDGIFYHDCQFEHSNMATIHQATNYLTTGGPFY